MISIFYVILEKIEHFYERIDKQKNIAYNISNNYYYYLEDTMIKYSKQRDSIKKFLADREDHPTAETVYWGIKEEFPNISLGTVYRNLALLANLGEILKLSIGNTPDRFDGRTNPHYHFLCNTCGNVLDLEMENIDHINVIAGHKFAGNIDGSVTYFYGTCPNCTNVNGNDELL